MTTSPERRVLGQFLVHPPFPLLQEDHRSDWKSLKDLKLTYNRARQAAITTEIIEISSGAEALKG